MGIGAVVARPNVSVLISSFDGYADCWDAVSHGLSKYWPDCPYPVYLIANRRDFFHPRVNILRTHSDDWSSALRSALDRLDTEYVMYFQEDYWLQEPVCTRRIREYVELMDTHRLSYIRLLAKPAPDRDFPHDQRLGVISELADYRTSVQVSLWRARTLASLLRGGESAWQFEIDGTPRSRTHGGTFLSVKPRGRDEYLNGVRYLCSAINRGKWSRAAHAYARREGLQIDFSRRPTETWWDELGRTTIARFLTRWTSRARLSVSRPKVAFRRVRQRLGSRHGAP